MKDSFAKYFGGLYMNYTTKYYCNIWYEGYSQLRRTVIIGIVVLFPALARNVEPFIYIILGCVLSVQFFVQRIFRPYVIDMENVAEEISLFTLIVLCLSRGSGAVETNKYALFGLLLSMFATTFVFLFCVVLKTNATVFELLQAAMQKLKLCCTCCKKVTKQNDDSETLVIDETPYTAVTNENL